MPVLHPDGQEEENIAGLKAVLIPVVRIMCRKEARQRVESFFARHRIIKLKRWQKIFKALLRPNRNVILTDGINPTR
jgi:hypothetical protein